MKCPKCDYLGFEEVDRCRNCGYDFSLMSAPEIPELPLRSDHADLGPLDDLTLVDAAAQLFPSESARSTAVAEPASRSQSRSPTTELPLFGSSQELETAADDSPLITRASPPRPPLAVRRATQELPRLRSSLRQRTPMLDLSAFETEPPTVVTRRAQPEVPRRQDGSGLGSVNEDSVNEDIGDAAGVSSRVGAALVDLLILAAIDVVVVYLTMQVCGITVDELRLLPKAPLIAFLAVQNLGYLIGFTVSGQTLGKMVTGIKVVSAEDDEALDFGRSVVRTLVWVALVVPAGLGFLTALFRDDHRGLHDRCAGTKVVRASA